MLPVDTDSAAAVGASPADFFVCHKLPNSKPLDVFEILDHAHVVSGSIPFIHVFHLLAGKTVTLEAELQIPLLKDFTVLDLASEDADGFIGVFHPATWAGVFISQVCHASAAIHSTGGDELDFDHLVSFNLPRLFSRFAGRKTSVLWMGFSSD